MKNIPTPLILALAMFVLVCGVVVAERSLNNPAEIPQALFFGIPFVGLAIAFFSAYRGFTLSKAQAAGWRRMKPYLGVVLLLTILPMWLLNDRYRGDYDPLGGRLAPNGASVHSISWSKQGGRYVERLNGRFDVEITEAQYREIMGKHQRALVSVVVVFASLGFWMSAAMLVLEHRERQNGS
jgi:hypothetical protein